MSFILTLSCLSSSIIFLCLGLSSKHAVIFEISLFLASALDTLECQFQGRFIFKKDNDILRAKKMGVTELDRKYNIKDIVKGDSIFCATGITSGDMVKGITIKDDDYISETFLTHKSTKTKKIYSQKNKISQ